MFIDDWYKIRTAKNVVTKTNDCGTLLDTIAKYY